MLHVILSTVYFILNIVWFFIIVSVVFSWLYAFNVINTRNQFVSQIGSAIYAVTEPIYRPIRRFMPNLNGLDLSPLVVIVILYFLQQLVAYLDATYAY